MELIVLGSSGTWPNAGIATSGYLVRHDGFNLYMDAGTGTLANLQKHIDIEDVDAIVVSHEHPDHFVDLYPFFYAWHYGELGKPGLPVFVPTDFSQRLADLVAIDSQVAMRTAFAFTEVAPGEAFEVGPFRVKTEPMAHLGLPALGFRIHADGQVLAYTGDTGPTHHVEELARDADALLAEATWQDRDDLLPFHLSARQAAIHAREAGVGKLILTHIWPTLDREVSRTQAAEDYDGPIETAAEGMRFDLDR
ncbi:MAG TPA: MBL fold metallo-hydrolase [Actinomycetota bacterium]|jgi:ribonuclease BN (tRNA processing enzyme)|nr:MBL fold metallo-hydrolase [Actinomycetota bacterium]